MHGPGCCQHDRSPGRETQAHKIVSRNFQRGFSFGSDFYDAAFARQGSGHIQIAIGIEGKALRPAQSAIRNVLTVPCVSIRYTASKLDVVGPVTNRSPLGLNAR